MKKIIELLKVYLLDKIRSPVTVVMSIVWGLAFFLFLFFLFEKGGVTFGQQNFKEMFVASYFVFIPAYIGVFGVNYAVMEDKTNGLMKAYRSSRLTKPEYLAAKTGGAVLGASFISALILLFGMYSMNFPVHPIVFSAVLITTVVAHAGIGFLTSTISGDMSESRIIMPLLMITMVVATPVFYPSTMLPEAIQPLQQIFPLTHSIEIMRATVSGSPGVVRNFVELSVSALIFMAAAFKRFKF